MGDKNSINYVVGGLSSSASFSSNPSVSSNYYSATTIDPYYTIRIDTEEAKKQILDAVKDEMKKDEDVNDLLEIAKAILLDYVSKTTEKPEVIFEDLNNKLKKKDEEIELLKSKIESLESRLATLEANREYKKWYSDGITCTGGTDSSSVTYTFANSSIDLGNSSSQTI
jgi:vacuolar-type H+-ATPase subunit I/STV1